MTAEEGISKLRRYKRFVYGRKMEKVYFPQKSYVFTVCAYGSFLVDELIRKIRYSDADPIRIVGQMYTEFDYVLGESDDDHFVTHDFAALMEEECGKILQYLKFEEGKNAQT